MISFRTHRLLRYPCRIDPRSPILRRKRWSCSSLAGPHRSTLVTAVSPQGSSALGATLGGPTALRNGVCFDPIDASSTRRHIGGFRAGRAFSSLPLEDDSDEEALTTKAEQKSSSPHRKDSGIHASSLPTIEEQYSRKTPLEHILLRPGMYIGPTERLPPTMSWVLEDPPPPPPPPPLLPSQEPNLFERFTPPPSLPESSWEQAPPLRMVQREVSYIPALIKIFDEILVNASDQRIRNPDSCTRLDVTIYPGSKHHPPMIRVYNNGPSIPIEMHKTENLYVPDLLFGHLLTGSNFDDTAKRVTGGRHGYGAKLANIFSSKFQVETANVRERRLVYRQTWTNNMRQTSLPEIRSLDDVTGDWANDVTEDYTCITFFPDMNQLSNGEADLGAVISPEEYALMCRRVVDVAGCNAATSHLRKASALSAPFRVTLNGVDVTQNSFSDYCLLYRQPQAQENDSPTTNANNAFPLCFHAINDRWNVAVGRSETGSLEAVSFVNGMATPRGGSHVNVLVNQVSKRIVERVSKLAPDLASAVTLKAVRQHLFLGVNALIENPTFDSQMKEYLTSSPSSFGSTHVLPDTFLNSQVLRPVEKGGPGIVEEVIRTARGQAIGSGGKKTKRQLMSMIPKLEDAHLAGTDKGYECTLILTEGDSAKALAVAGLEEIGRDRFGVFPLRGKLLNVRTASISQLKTNGEINALCSILGLDPKRKYDTVSARRSLRYGRIMIMTDQDTDGSHIKGLVVNFFRIKYPKLLQPPVDEDSDTSERTPPFLSSFVTPLLKATKKGKKGEVLSFYSLPEYQAWRDQIADDAKKWNVKYYKGLGTSTTREAKEYFASFDNHYRPFYWSSETDGELLDMVFDKGRASERKEWIQDTQVENVNVAVDLAKDRRLSYEDFVNQELIQFSRADITRSIPSLIDGLKPSQRKVLYACFKRNLKSEIKVAQLTGYCAEHTAYHHGEASLHSTIIGMAQDFIGSNNVNLLVPSGQFGTRLAGGKDAASPRYIFTQLSPIARLLFPEVDDALLNYREDDGQSIEPEYYCPVIPLIVVNGSQGIGTGWSTYIPPHHPMDVLEYVRAKLDGSCDLPTIHPFARGFAGSFETGDGGYETVGRAYACEAKTVVIDELPLGCWTNKYKEMLLKMRDRGDILGFSENHTTSKVLFRVEVRKSQLQRIESSGLEKYFKLRKSLSTANMHAFDAQHQIRKFESPQAIADAYFPVRLQLYHDRKSLLESELNHSATVLRNKARFIESVTRGQIDLVSGRKTKLETAADLRNHGFVTASDLRALKNDNALSARRRDLHLAGAILDAPEPAEDLSTEFEYLLSMPISSLAADRIQDLGREADRKDDELRQIRSLTPQDLWQEDLDRLATALDRYLGE